MVYFTNIERSHSHVRLRLLSLYFTYYLDFIQLFYFLFFKKLYPLPHTLIGNIAAKACRCLCLSELRQDTLTGVLSVFQSAGRHFLHQILAVFFCMYLKPNTFKMHTTLLLYTHTHTHTPFSLSVCVYTFIYDMLGKKNHMRYR